jgi:hypothetical protein
MRHQVGLTLATGGCHLARQHSGIRQVEADMGVEEISRIEQQPSAADPSL